MPLFICQKCKCIDNTALSACSWIEYLHRKPMLCSECCPKQKKWHGRFKKKKWDGKMEVLNKDTKVQKYD